MGEQEKQELNILLKEYEIVAKSYDETLKMFFGVPIFVAAIIGLLLPKETIEKINSILHFSEGLSVIVIFLLISYCAGVAREIAALKNYRSFLEKRINEYFNKELIGYATKNIRLEKKYKTIEYFVQGIFVLLVCIYSYFHFVENFYYAEINRWIILLLIFAWAIIKSNLYWKSRR